MFPKINPTETIPSAGFLGFGFFFFHSMHLTTFDYTHEAKIIHFNKSNIFSHKPQVKFIKLQKSSA